MSIQNNEAMTTATRSNFLLPQAMDTTFTAEELAEDMDGLQMNFQQVKVPAGGALQYEVPTEDPDNPDYSRTLEGVMRLSLTALISRASRRCSLWIPGPVLAGKRWSCFPAWYSAGRAAVPWCARPSPPAGKSM